MFDDPETNWIEIPNDLLIHIDKDKKKSIIEAIYHNFEMFYKDSEYLKERAIVTPTNDDVDVINNTILEMISTDCTTYFNLDTMCYSTIPLEELQTMYHLECLTSIKQNGIPSHQLKLKIGCPIILMRNIDQASGMCNGT